MNANGRSRLADLKAISIIVGIMLGIGAVVGGAFAWANGLQTKFDARVEHQKLEAADEKIEHKANRVYELSNDVKVIKCLMLAPNRKAKEKCGLQ